jgi:phosphatidylglycerol lysyltransferase
MNRKLVNLLGSVLGFSLFLAALWVLHRELSAYHYRDLAVEARSVPAARLYFALLLTVVNYLVLTGYDALAFRYIGRSLKYARIAFASFIGYAFSNNMGLSMLAGSSVRYRLYTAWGLSAVEVAKMVAFYTLTLWLGLLSLSGLVFIIEPVSLPSALHVPAASVRLLGIVFLAVAGGYVVWSVVGSRSITIGRRSVAIPAPGLSLAQLAISSLDWLLAGSVLAVLLPPVPGFSLPFFFSIFFLAQVAGLVSQVPGGLGVFETVFLLLLPPGFAAPQAVGALLVYRGVYYLLPLMIASAMLGVYELARARSQLAGLARFVHQGLASVAPPLLSAIIFAGGALLLFSGATPELPHRLAWIRKFLPLPLQELSHFLGSLAGLALLLLARGIQRRLDSAYHLTIALLAAGIVFSLAKGLDYEEALILAFMLAALLPGKRFFYRRASLLSQRFTAGWIAAIAAVLSGSVWLGFFAYRHLDYSQDLWWQFTVHGDAPRFLRATVGVIVLSVIIGMVKLLRPAPPEPILPDRGLPDLVRAVVAASTDTTASLALLGDKRFLFSESGRSFIMYGIEGRSWIAMGDPVGPEDEWKDLVWRYRELCDRQNGWPVFYEVCKENLYLYLDLGLAPLKIGEEARVPLQEFSLEGSPRKGLRYIHSRMQREGAVFSMVPASGVPPLLPRLKSISDAWLADKHTREKRFSLGYFNEDYLALFPCALVRRGDAVIAFSNVWEGADKEELSIDLMRQLPGSSPGIMEFLFVELLLWGRHQGYRWFNLGMVPLAGLEDRSLAPIWNRLGSRVFRHGEHFYNFQGLRRFKEHFEPQWEPKYLVAPRGFLLPRILANLATLISGGLMGVVKK